MRSDLVVVPPPGLYAFGVVPGGAFEGQRLSGEVLDGGSDWQTVRNDGSTTLDVRRVLKTTDDAPIGMTYRGIRQGWPTSSRVSTRARCGSPPTTSGSRHCSRRRHPDILG